MLLLSLSCSQSRHSCTLHNPKINAKLYHHTEDFISFHPLPLAPRCSAHRYPLCCRLSATKRIMQGGSFTISEIIRGTSLEVIRGLCQEGGSIPLNLDYEMRPLKAALRDAR